MSKKGLVIEDDPELGSEADGMSDTAAEITFHSAKISNLLQGGYVLSLAFSSWKGQTHG